MERILQHWNIPITTLPLFLDDADGTAALALLANAGAKDWTNHPGNPTLYTLKAEAVRWACLTAWTGRSWQDAHNGMVIYFIQTRMLLDGQPPQLAFHFRSGDTTPYLPGWPSASGRRWSGQPAQPRAQEIAMRYLAGRGMLMAGAIAL